MKKIPLSRERAAQEPEGLVAPLFESTSPCGKNICAVVITYYPDQGFEDRLRIILPQVAQVVVIDNTPQAIALSLNTAATWGERIHCIVNHSNRGVGVALNQGLEYALQRGFPWVLTLDQDTECYSNMVESLGSAYEDCSPKPAVIGSNYFDPRNHRLKAPLQGNECRDQETVITSGSLVNTKVALMVGGFREDYFIDQLDHEFCLRLRAQGYRVVISREPVMIHSVGCSGGVDVPFLGTLPNHPPLRKYYIARNTVVTIAAYWRQEPGWCFRRFVRLVLGLGYMAILEENRFAKVRAFAAGIADGICHRLGPCQREWLIREE